jgi:hypothetical protein
VKFVSFLGAYRICRCVNAAGEEDEAEAFDEDEEDEERFVENCLSYREASIRQLIIIGNTRPFHIIKNGTLYGYVSSAGTYAQHRLLTQFQTQDCQFVRRISSRPTSQQGSSLNQTFRLYKSPGSG